MGDQEAPDLVVSLDLIGSSDLSRVGGKAANLGELRRAGLPVPDGFVITTDAYRAGSDRDGELREAVGRAYDLLGGDVAVAVRSSATAEDLPQTSFAGQQESYLGVVGLSAIMTAVADCWASLHGERAVAYRVQQRVDGEVAMAVIVQRLVEPDASGVMFTANPSTGDRDEVLISASWGLGESVVGGLVDPDELVVVDGRVRQRRTADKQTMVVRAGEGTEQRRVPEELRRRPAIDDVTALRLAELGRTAAAVFGAPQDLEWVLARGELSLVQSRPITALPEPSGPVPHDWSVPDASCWYFRASIVEQLPDPLSPLFASMIDSSVRRSLQALMGELLGRDLVGDHDVGLPTINGYAYYAYSVTGMLKITLQAPLAFPVLVEGGRRSGIRRWREVAHPDYVRTVEAWSERDPARLDDAVLLRGLRELLDAGTAYYTSVQTIIPVAACSELIFTWYYEHLVRRAGDPPALTLLLGGDSAPIRAEKSGWDLARWVAGHPELAAWLSSGTPADSLDLRSRPDAVAEEVWSSFTGRLDDHQRRFGHAVYNLDFVNPVPAEDPTPLLDAVRLYLAGHGVDPYARQAGLADRASAAAIAVRGRLGRWRGPLFDSLLAWARRTGPVREDALADVGLAWPSLRAIIAELGRRLVERGALSDPVGVCWLSIDELARDLPGLGESRDAVVAERRRVWRGRRRAVPPQVLPRTRLTRAFDRWLPAASEQSGDRIRGLAGSSGRVTAVARVIAGPSDFSRLQPGEVLVAAITTPAWTTLFTRAAAVVTDIGGPLSHSSIVAREYGIPAVLGTGVATRTIPDGAWVEVDGDSGVVRILDDPVKLQVGGTG